MFPKLIELPTSGMGYQLKKLFKIELEYLLKVCSASINYLWTSHLRDWIRVVAPVWVTKTDLGLDNWKIGCLKSLPVFFHGLLLFFFMVFEVLSCLFMVFKVSSCLFFMVFEVSSGLFHGLGRVQLRNHICSEDKFNVMLPWKCPPLVVVVVVQALVLHLPTAVAVLPEIKSFFW